jgi:uncharacterized surface protein with fasciclin (FAS1) repeats
MRQHTRAGAALPILLILAIAGLVAPPSARPARAGEAAALSCSSLVDLKRTAERTGVLMEMAAATRLAGLDDPEVDVGPLTLLAPTDKAFNALPKGFRERLLAPENRQHLTALLMHHAVLGEFPTERLRRAKAKNFTIQAVDASEIEIFTNRGIQIESAKLVEADIRATDGIIHLIDKVLIPPSVKAALWDETEVGVEPEKLAEAAE